MPVPNTFLTVIAALGLWWAGHAWTCGQERVAVPAKAPAFAIPGSAYGSLTARVMRDGLFSYWHNGISANPILPKGGDGHDHGDDDDHHDHERGHVDDDHDHDHDHGAAAMAPGIHYEGDGHDHSGGKGLPGAPSAEEDPSLIGRGVTELARLEKARTRRSKDFPLTPAHRRYLSASIGWRLRLAHELDPGDAVIYEILHYHLSTQGDSSAVMARKVDNLAQEAMTHGLAPRASMSDALTGAGAGINLLNDWILRRRSGQPVSDDHIRETWSRLSQCLDRYRKVRAEADKEGWWQGIPPVRQGEIQYHAEVIFRIADTVRKTLVQDRIIH